MNGGERLILSAVEGNRAAPTVVIIMTNGTPIIGSTHDPEEMVTIPDRINDVTVEFDPGVGRRVKQSLVELLTAAVHPLVAPGFPLATMFISSAADRHALPSRHAMGRAVDISRINRKRLAIFYPTDTEVRDIVDALIWSFQICGPVFMAREIFGPGAETHGVKLKLGKPWPGVKDHLDHIHLSEGDRASIAGCPWADAGGNS